MDFEVGTSDGCALDTLPDLAGPAWSPDPARVEVAIVGGGLAGSILALTLARTGFSVAVIDETAFYRSDFRCEKLNARQAALLAALGVDAVVKSAIAPHKGLIEVGFRYDHLVNAIRAAWPLSVRFVASRVANIVTHDASATFAHRVVSARGALADAKLVVLATGPSPTLAAALGLTRQVLRRRHSIGVGFSLAFDGAEPAGLDGLVAPGETAGDKIALASLFRSGEALRVNLFSYHDPCASWAHQARRDPLSALRAAWPRLADRLAGAQIVGPIEMRVTDLYRTDPSALPGVVLIGDAFQSSCPATGFGVTRLLTDIRQLALVYIPDWLASPGIGPEKIDAFYADREKAAVDREALRAAARARSIAVETAWYWRAYRVAAKVKRLMAASLKNRRRCAHPQSASPAE